MSEKLRDLEGLKDSLFYQRLGGSGIQDFVEVFARKAAALLGRTSQYMPLYTLHDETHILNVLAWMEWLAGDAVEDLSPLECALCVMAAYAHDLGMTLTSKEHRELLSDGDSEERLKYRDFIDGFVDEKYEIERLRNSSDAQDNYAGTLLEAHLLTEFLRRTHSDVHAARMRARLDELLGTGSHASLTRSAQLTRSEPQADDNTLFGINDQPDQFRRWLELIAISHNQDVGWLRDQLQREGGFDTSTHGQTVNAVFISLLLRLADVMDFDSSRTPTILFHHLGLDREFGGRFSSFERLSQQEWKKHLAIHDIVIRKRKLRPVNAKKKKGKKKKNRIFAWTVSYRANACDHPAVEKSIHEFIDWIRREVTGCRTELEALRRHATVSSEHYTLRLPEVNHRVTPKLVAGQPAYTYRDWHFRLDQQEIIRLLMGESLYGDPSLCIRELLQNSLDALELRDLRLQVPMSERREPVDGIQLEGEQGYYRDENGEKHRLEVHLTWGRGIREDGSDSENGPWWIQVEDNGVGMTPSVIENFFTQLGRSYYRSAEFESEKADLRRHGLLATPISQFGIGVLSCFMIAERLEVRTCPADASVDNLDPNRRPTDLTISGPGSMFWTKRGSRKKQGTDIRLILHRELGGKPVSLIHDDEIAIRKLRQAFRYEVPDPRRWSDEDVPTFDPACIAAQHVVWPKYAVRAQTSTKGTVMGWTIDDTFHVRILAPLEQSELKTLLNVWGIPKEEIGALEWCYHDWSDDSATDGQLPTGSRIRLWFVRARDATDCSLLDDNSHSLPLSRLAAFVQAQWEGLKSRVIVKSMHVSEVSLDAIQVCGSLGTHVWIDLRGAAEVRLSVDRSKALKQEQTDRWLRATSGIWRRFQFSQAAEVNGEIERCRNLLSLLRVTETVRKELSAIRPINALTWTLPIHRSASEETTSGWADIELSSAEFVVDLLLSTTGLPADLVVIRDVDLASRLTRDQRLASGLRRVFDGMFDHALALKRGLVLTRVIDRPATYDHGRDLAFVLALAVILERAPNRTSEPPLVEALGNLIYHAGDLDRTCHGTISAVHSTFNTVWATSILQQAFWPALESSWPSCELFVFRGRMGDTQLTAPASCKLDVESDGHTVVFADRQGIDPVWLVELQYDLCWPLPSIPLGRLRRDCPGWREDRSYQTIGTMPLIFPSCSAVWPQHAVALREQFGVPQIYALFPSPELWTKPFSEWTSSDRGRSDHLSILWNIETGAVHYAGGIQPPEETVTKGRTFADLIAEIDKNT